MVREQNITSITGRTRVSGMSDWELQQIQDRIARVREDKKERERLAEANRPVESVKENPLLSLGKEAFQRRLAEISKRKPRREEDYDGPSMPPPPRADNTCTHRCPDCHYMVNETDTHGWKRREVPNSYDVKPEPCPTCSPAVKRCQNGKKARRWIQDLVSARVFTDLCNMPDGAEDLNFTEFGYLPNTDENASQEVCRFVDGSTKNLFLWGETGRGKTGLAISALHELKLQGLDCLMLSMKSYLDLLRADMDKAKKNEEISHIRQIVRGVPVLLLDDMGVERVTETGFAVEETQGLVEDRHALGLRTVITTNMNLPGLEKFWHMEKHEKYGFQPASRIVSRLKGWYKVVQVGGIDQRIGE